MSLLTIKAMVRAGLFEISGHFGQSQYHVKRVITQIPNALYILISYNNLSTSALLFSYLHPSYSSEWKNAFEWS